jgi:UDP-2-acetamido-3-amino-2,3-dideoxy-glucuronate N-acetyltransferase
MTSKIHPTAFIHESAIVDPGVEIGADTKIWHFCHIMTGAKIGKGCSFGQGCHVSGAVVIGDNCKIQNGVSLYDGVILEDQVFIGPHAVFTNVKFPRAHRKGKFETTLIKRGATIGAGAILVCGIEVGEFAMVAAGCVCTRNAPPGTTIMGVPGVVKKSRSHQQELKNIKESI